MIVAFTLSGVCGGNRLVRDRNGLVGLRGGNKGLDLVKFDGKTHTLYVLDLAAEIAAFDDTDKLAVDHAPTKPP